MNIQTTITKPTPEELYKRAVKLLKRYDNLCAETRLVERELNLACTDYSRSKNMWGFSKDKLRAALLTEQQLREMGK